ncbi:hypothetical protein BS47DRAFT_353898 [Hydnum rufescens UP504]|uniref:CCL2-like lectin domain-containing protein n=1 Tax=Hydnum rufescens UP504 TaxID=1448309 RepID=A0A9P6DQ54_9AGAM|nr:hypothetical protein BS47DRAFT_353898 [Hydnum rufescens UP504]
MAELPSPPPVYFIVNRLLLPGFQELAAQYNHVNQPLTAPVFDPTNKGQLWVIASLEKPTTIVPFHRRDEQAAAHELRPPLPEPNFVIAETAVRPHEWLIRSEDPDKPLENVRIIDFGKPVGKPGEIWGLEKPVPGEKVALEDDKNRLDQRWDLRRVALPE